MIEFTCIEVLIIITLINSIESDQNILSRKRRFIAFPQGSSVSAAICTTIGQIGNPEVNLMSYAINWGVSYNLPNETWVVQAANGFKTDLQKDQLIFKRRYRRSILNNIETAISSMGYDGEQCIKRTLCEASLYLFGRTGNMIEELLKIIFCLPDEKNSTDDKYFNRHHIRYHKAVQHGKIFRKTLLNYNNNMNITTSIKHNNNINSSQNTIFNENCSKFYGCNFSLIELAFGKYSIETKIPTPRNYVPVPGFM